MNLWVVQDQREPLLRSVSILVWAAQPWVVQALTVLRLLTMMLKWISADLDLVIDPDFDLCHPDSDPDPDYDHDHVRFRIADDPDHNLDYNVDLDPDCLGDDNPCDPGGDHDDDHDDLGNHDHANHVDGDRTYRDHDLVHDDHHVVHGKILCLSLGLAKVS